MVSGIRNIELALSGDGFKQPSASEAKNMAIARKSIHLAQDCAKGLVLRASDLTMMRPGDGISPMRMDDIIGKTLKHACKANHKLSSEDFQ
jgi:N-acetylneuraminate synthase/N,N'-diacetyllegionaminate synthase